MSARSGRYSAETIAAMRAERSAARESGGPYQAGAAIRTHVEALAAAESLAARLGGEPRTRELPLAE
jgi:hypothetical protein